MRPARDKSMKPTLLTRIENRAIGAFRLIAAVLLFLLMMLTCLDVLGRYFFNRPVYGGLELTEIMLAGVVFFALPVLTWRGGHVVVDLVSLRGRWVLRLQHVLANLLGAAVCVALAWQLWLRGDRLRRTGETTIQIEIPMDIVAYTISVMLALTAVVFLHRAITRPGDVDQTDKVAE